MTTVSIAETSIWGGWALDRATALELSAHLRRTQPQRIFEAGSGYSTAVLAEYARDTGASVISAEHNPTYLSRTSGILEQNGLTPYVSLRHSPLSDMETPAGTFPWYDLPAKPVDFALIDGPPGTIGRTGALFALTPWLRGEWEVWLDDADRPGEQNALKLWHNVLGLAHQHIPLPRGLAVIRGSYNQQSVDASDFIITILTGHRPQLLLRTMKALRTVPGLMETARVVILHNGNDQPTQEIIDDTDAEVIRLDTHHLVSIGEAMCRIRNRVTASPQPFWMHIEDDWELASTTPASSWLTTVRETLNNNPDIGQIRLRHRAESTLQRNMSTRAPITWIKYQELPDVLLSDSAHYTCNPSVMRSRDAALPWPGTATPDIVRRGENAAIDRYVQSKYAVAQLDPGLFFHIGGNLSLRAPQHRND